MFTVALVNILSQWLLSPNLELKLCASSSPIFGLFSFPASPSTFLFPFFSTPLLCALSIYPLFSLCSLFPLLRLLFIMVVPYMMVVISRDTVLGSSVWFLSAITSLKPTIVQIIGHFLTSVKFHEISRQYQNSMEKGKFHGLAWNSAARGKLWALVICISFHEDAKLGQAYAWVYYCIVASLSTLAMHVSSPVLSYWASVIHSL